VASNAEREVLSISGCDSLADALVNLELITPGERAEVVDVTEWMPGGAETYILVFDVVTKARASRYLVKASVTLALPPRESIEMWLQRRRLVAQLGIRTPQLVGVGPAGLIEEFVQDELLAAMSGANVEDRRELVGQTAWALGRLSAAGFTLITISDWRAAGTVPVIIDFGADLGTPGRPTNLGEAHLISILDKLRGSGAVIQDDDVEFGWTQYSNGRHVDVRT
jgi:hypothetical protein